MRTHWHTQRGVYHAANPTYRADEPNSRVHQLALAGHVHVFGYRAADMSPGFGFQETADFVRSVCTSPWVYDPEKGILRPAEVFKNAEVGVARGPNHADISIMQPDAQLLAENDCLAHYRKALKFHEIKKRRNVPSEEPDVPLLVRLGIGTNATSLLDYLVEHSAFILEWFHCDWADNIRTIDGTANAKAFLLAKFAEANLPVFEIDDPDDLPYD